MHAWSSAQLNLNWLESVTATTKCLDYIHPDILKRRELRKERREN